MRIPIYHGCAFASRLFEGNPAAICVLKEWLPAQLLQHIAAENNLSETGFIVPQAEGEYAIRWFTCKQEVILCGHATLAAAYVVFNYCDLDSKRVIFHSASGLLTVQNQGHSLEMDFPRIMYKPLHLPQHLLNALPCLPQEAYTARNCLLIYANEQQIHDFQPDYASWQPFTWHGLIITAPSHNYDFVSRFFGYNARTEDPVTGSAHCMLAPYWSKRLGKAKLHARQLSARGGELYCEVTADRVLLRGKVIPYLQGIIDVDV